MSKATQIILLFCATFSSAYAGAREIDPPYNVIELKTGDSVQFEGFIEYRGEVVFYTSKAAKSLRLVYPYCISGASDLDTERVIELSRHKVVIQAEAFDVVKDIDSNSISTFVFVAGMPIKNWCLGTKALKITNIQRSK